MKIKHIPRMVAISGSIFVLGSTAYAITNWFGTQTSVQQHNKLVTVSAKDCPSPIWQMIQQNYPQASYSLTNTWEIVRPQAITAQQIEQAQLVSCEENAVQAIAHKQFPDIYFGVTSHSKIAPTQDGLYSALGSYGTIQAIDSQHVTVTDVAPFKPWGDERLTVTMSLQGATLVSGGMGIGSQDLHIGDQVYFVYQDPATDTSDGFNPVSGATLRVLAKTQYDYKALKALYQAANRGDILLRSSNDKFAG